MKEALSKILALADEILSGELTEDDLTASLEQYGKTFQEWFEAHQETIESSLPQDLQDKLLALQEKHTAVLARAESFRKETSTALSGLKKRGRGLMAYIDILPRKISTRRTRKG